MTTNSCFQSMQHSANKTMQRIAIPLRSIATGDGWRVCRAWHKTREVKVLLPGNRRAEG